MNRIFKVRTSGFMGTIYFLLMICCLAQPAFAQGGWRDWLESRDSLVRIENDPAMRANNVETQLVTSEGDTVQYTVYNEQGTVKFRKEFVEMSEGKVRYITTLNYTCCTIEKTIEGFLLRAGKEERIRLSVRIYGKDARIMVATNYFRKGNTIYRDSAYYTFQHLDSQLSKVDIYSSTQDASGGEVRKAPPLELKFRYGRGRKLVDIYPVRGDYRTAWYYSGKDLLDSSRSVVAGVEEKVSYTYDKENRLISKSIICYSTINPESGSAQIEYGYGYDKKGRLISEWSEIKSAGGKKESYSRKLTYNPGGRLASIHEKNGMKRKVRYFYLSNGLPEKTEENNGRKLKYSYTNFTR